MGARFCAAPFALSTLSSVPGPLSHLVVLDLSRVLAGPWCTQLLADLGAEVIKIEKPGSGDDTRSWGPPFLKDMQGRDTGEAAYYLACNRGKKSVAVDFTQSAGQDIDVSLLDAQVAMMAVMNMNYLVSGTPPDRAGNAHQNIVPYQVFACADGHLILAVGNDAQFARFCEIAGKTEWARDPRFAANAERVKRRDVLVPLIEVVMHSRTQGEWLAALEAVGVRCGPINRLDQVFADPQVRARGMRFDLPHRLSGTVPQVGNPLHFSATPVAYTQAPPLLGEYTSAVLSQRLDLSAESLADLAARGVVEVVERD